MARRRHRRAAPVATNRRRNPRRHYRRNPSRRNNPGGGITHIVTGGLWIGAGMWLGGLIGGFIPRFGSGFIMDAVHGLITAYGVAWVGGRFTHNAGLMAMGAFAPTALGLVSSVVGGAGSLVGGITGSLGGGKTATPAPDAQLQKAA